MGDGISLGRDKGGFPGSSGMTESTQSNVAERELASREAIEPPGLCPSPRGRELPQRQT